MVLWPTCSQFRTPTHVSSLESGGASISRQLHWLPVSRRVDFKISTLVYCLLAGTAPVYLADTGYHRWPPSSVVCRQSNMPGQEVTQPVQWPLFLLPPGQCCGTVCLNSFGNRTSPSANSNDRWKRLCLVSWAAAPCVWTLRALTKNLLTHLLLLKFHFQQCMQVFSPLPTWPDSSALVTKHHTETLALMPKCLGYRALSLPGPFAPRPSRSIAKF